LDLLTQEAAKADIIVNNANNDDLPSVEALFKGQKSRNDPNAVFIQTSGTGELTYNRKTEIPHDDEDIARYQAIPPDAPHANVDHWIWKNTDGLRVAVIDPCTIYGIGTGPVNKLSIQVPIVVRASISRGSAGWIGPRDDIVWGSVHILDLVDLYLLVLDGLEKGTIDHGKAGGLYFGITEDFKWFDLAHALSKALNKLGLIKNEKVSAFEDEYVDKFFFGAKVAEHVWGSDSKGVANRSKRIGWKPSRPTLFETLESEVQFMRDNGKL